MYLNKPQNDFLHIYNKLKENTLFKIILYFISIVFLFLYKTRLLFYKFNFIKTKKLSVPVISVGNITCGGTGKTPVVIELAKNFLKEGYKVAILSRGYKRKPINSSNTGVLLVSDGQDILTNYSISGDEPYLIAKKVPKAIVVVGKDRVRTGKAAIKLGADILILDDGYQHIRLNRDENILLLDAYHPFDNGHLLPLGKLRELPDSINRATSIIISNANKSQFDKIEKIKNDVTSITSKQVIYMKYKIKELNALNIKKIINIEELNNMPVIAFCGIGNSKSFLDNLKENNLDIKEFLDFEDHHDYSYDDIKHISEVAKKNNIENIITTEKDAIKVEDLCLTEETTFWSTKLEIIWDPPDGLNTLTNLLITKGLSPLSPN